MLHRRYISFVCQRDPLTKDKVRLEDVLDKESKLLFIQQIPKLYIVNSERTIYFEQHSTLDKFKEKHTIQKEISTSSFKISRKE